MSECYCAALRLAARRASATYDDALAEVGINVAQFSLLRNIDVVGAPSLTLLGQRTGLERSTVGRNCQVLEKLRLIEPAVGDDGRETCVVLTEQGHRTLKAALPLWRRAQRQFEKALGPESAAQLQALLRSLQDDARQDKGSRHAL